jgi:hypothetical protein
VGEDKGRSSGKLRLCLLACLVMIQYDIIKQAVDIVPAGPLFACLNSDNCGSSFIITRFITSGIGKFWREFISAALHLVDLQ